MAGSLVDTDKGLKPVERTPVGDLVLTRDNGYQPVLWTGHHAQSEASLAARPDLAAVIVRGALGWWTASSATCAFPRGTVC